MNTPRPTIRQTTAFVTDLVEEARLGRLVPATFQRPYRWTKPTVLDLWHSLAMQCPIGSALVWYPAEAEITARFAHKRLGPITITPDLKSGILLDGHNRIASFAWSMSTAPAGQLTGLSAEERETWCGEEALVLDAASRSFAFEPRTAATRPARFEPHMIFDTIGINRALRARPADDCTPEMMEWLDEIGTAARNARMTLTILDGHTPQDAYAIYKRIVRVGAPISDADFARALEWEDSIGS